ncbi:jg10189 [Pararge aegeria aegeria]|uniref:non-specific serine/threonine protein kinase n=1 Tax=Pararge aegeria aegeria TaxID=348720 RepID=A0A8S4SB53_9NEOP|nr:jg10189 [Pararge aegeria aegeria]
MHFGVESSADLIRPKNRATSSRSLIRSISQCRTCSKQQHTRHVLSAGGRGAAAQHQPGRQAARRAAPAAALLQRQAPPAEAAPSHAGARYMLTRGSSKRHTMATPEDAAGVSVCAPAAMASSNPSSTANLRVRRTGLLTVTERPPVISPELVMEVEARMNRNYLPPSIQGGYSYPGQAGYQSPPPCSQPPTSQGSITAGTPSYTKNCMKPVLETILQGSIMGAASQAASPYTPAVSQYSPTHGTVASQTGSIVSGTPISHQAGIPDQAFSDSINAQNSASIVSGTPIPAQSYQKQGSIMSGTPMQSQSIPPNILQGQGPTSSAIFQTQGIRLSQRGLERRGASLPGAASPPHPAHTPAASVPGSPIHAPALDLAAADPAAQDLSLKLGINLNNLYTSHLSQEVLKSLHSYGSFGLLSGHTSPASPGSPLHQITEGLSYLHTGSITRGTPQANATPLDLRSNVDMDTNYPQLHPMVHPQIHVVAHRSLNNSPISNPGSPLDMIQEEIGNGSHNGGTKFPDRTFQAYPSTHPQISLTDCLGSEITLVASSSEDSVDSLENSKYPLPQFVISEPSDLDDRPSITKGIGRKVSQETELVEHRHVELVDKDTEMPSPKESVDETSKYLTEELARRGSDKSLGFSDDSLSNDSANVSPNCEQNIQSIYSNIVSVSSGFSENRGSFSENRESFSFSDRGSFSERGDFGRSSFSERSDFGRSSFSEKGETPRSSISAQGILGEVKEYYEDVYMPRDKLEPCGEESREIDQLQRSTMDLRLTEICRPEEQKIPILLSPQKVSCVQEYYEVALSTVCSQLDSHRIMELLKETINTRVPPQNIFVETGDQMGKHDDSEALTGFLNLEYSGGIQIELVVCENKAKEKKGLKMRRISGDQREYGKLCQQLITSLTV